MASVAEIVLKTRDDASATIRRVASDLRTLDAGAGKVIRLHVQGDAAGVQRHATALGSAERSAQRLESAQIALARTSGNYRGALAQIDAAIDRAAGDELRLTNLQRARIGVVQQLERAQEKAARTGFMGGTKPAMPAGAGALGGIASLASGLGLAVGASEMLQFGISAVQAANSLERTQATVLALSGSQAKYNEVLALAREGQSKYGGTLQQNLTGLGALVNLSNRSGVSLASLDNIARRLATVDPLAGIEGANIALKEFFTGQGAQSVASLAARFELPKAALRALTAEGITTEQKLAGLDAALNQMGITNEVLSNALTTNAAKYTQMGAAADTAKTAVGGFLSQLALPAVGVATAFLTGLSDSLGGVHTRLVEANTSLVASGGSYTAYVAGVQAANTAHGDLTNKLTALTAAQYAATQALVANGVPATQALANVQNLGFLHQFLAQAVGASGQTLAAQAPQLLALAAASDQNRIAIEILTQGYIAGEVTAEAFRISIANLTTFQLAHRDATIAVADAHDRNAIAMNANFGATLGLTGAAAGLTAAQYEEYQSSQLSAAQTYVAAEAKRQLDADARNAADAMNLSGAAAINAGNALIASGGARNAAIGQYLLLAEAAREATRAQGQAAAEADHRAGERSGGKFDTAARQRNAHNAARTIEAERIRVQKEAEAAARASARPVPGAAAHNSAQTRADTAGQTDQQELAYWQNKIKSMKAGSTEYLNAQAKIKNLQARIANGSTSGASSANDLANARERADLAGLDTAGELAYWKNKLASLKQGSAEYFNALAKVKDLEARLKDERERDTTKSGTDAARDAEELRKAQEALMSNEEKLAAARQRLAGGNLPEVDRLELMKQIRDLEKEVSNEQEKQRKSALDAQLAAIDDRKQRREEAKQLAQAQRVLSSSSASEEQKAAARDVLERIPLEQQKRAMEIAEKQADARGASAAATAPKTNAEFSTQPVGARTALDGTPTPVTIDQPTLPPLPPQVIAGMLQQSITINAYLQMPDGSTAASGTVTGTFVDRNPIADLRVALRQGRT